MKFAQYLNDHAVPEWKSQYLDYKQGKKRLKKINSSPFLSSMRNSVTNTPKTDTTHNNSNNNTVPLPITKLRREQEQLNPVTPAGQESVRTDKTSNRRSSLVSFQLPPPAIANEEAAAKSHPNDDSQQNTTNDRTPLLTPSLPPESISSHSTELNRKRSRIDSFVKTIRRVSTITPLEDNHELTDYTENSKILFLEWVDNQLVKVEEFYRDRESHDMERFLILKTQISQLRQQRLILKQFLQKSTQLHDQDPKDDSDPAKTAHRHRIKDEIDHLKNSTKSTFSQMNRFELPSLPSLNWWLGKEKEKEYYEEGYNDDSTSDDHLSQDETLPESSHQHHHIQDPNYNKRDYSHKLPSVPYYIAKRQLKAALLELYRSLELLKSYRLLNRTAFRKMLKKFDKSTNSSYLPKYMEKIDQSYFITSNVLDELIGQIEDLYSFTFEKGNRKVAITKLRSNEVLQTFYSDFFKSGLLLGFALPLFVLAVYHGVHDTVRGILPEGRFLLQIWGGFFLATLMALLFGINCAIWSRFKINYKFIFEFDNRNSLDFRQFYLLPSISMLMIGFFGWFSFMNFWPTIFPGRYWPWFYVGIFLLIMFCPFNILKYHSRKWILISIWRLLLSGFYPVEFRDFFIGDIMCSLTYTISNISFFICLYATHWNGALIGGDTKCGSSSSRLMGFLATLPSIWRFMQCIRRFLDTGDWFPHLANCLKYTISLVYYIMLSVYRIDRTTQSRAVFIVFASINAIYSSIWDIFMDWSLMQANSKNLFLRDDLIFKNSWFYYVAIIFDVIMRFQWIFYAFFARQIQQSAVTSFCIALAEILRRFVWIFFRMENEHCTNVHLFRASRDTPLPYPVDKRVIQHKLDEYTSHITPLHVEQTSPFDDEERAVGLRLRKPSIASRVSEPPSMPTPALTRRQTLLPKGIEKISMMLNNAHIKDFQRRKVVPAQLDSIKDSDEENDTDEDEDEVIRSIVNSSPPGNA